MARIAFAARQCSGGGCRTLLHEALPTEYRPALGRLEGNGSLLAALGAGCAGFCLAKGRTAARRGRGGCAENRDAFRFAVLAALRFVLKLFVVEEQLLASCKDEIAATVDTLEDLVLEFHAPSPLFSVCLTPS